MIVDMNVTSILSLILEIKHFHITVLSLAKILYNIQVKLMIIRCPCH